MSVVIAILGLALISAAAWVGYILGRKSMLKRIEFEQSLHEAKLKLMEEQQKTARESLENLLHSMIEENSAKLTSQNQNVLHSVLSPLQERLQNFAKRIDDVYGAESRERFALQKEIARLMELNQEMSREAANLAKALKGDVKTQGNWGEVILERILESSGLRDGQEFVRQGEDLDLMDESGRRLRPDIVVHLPEGKHIIIDSKVSLVAFERSIHCETRDEHEQWCKQHVDSVLSHVRELSEKFYQGLSGVRSPDFVLMFLPIEGALSLAINTNMQLFETAWERKVVIVGPTTLLATLKTVASIWRQEKQSRHALEIAHQGGTLYDEFVRLTEDLKVLDKNLQNTRNSFDTVSRRLSHGRGNLLSRVEKLRELGVKTKKQLNMDDVDESFDSQDAEEPQLVTNAERKL